MGAAMRINWQRRRNDPRLGAVNMTNAMLTVLDRLYAEAEAGGAFASLGDVHHRTITALVERDWIVAGSVKQALYCITQRGKQARMLFKRPGHRVDGICPRCGTRLRGRYRTGTKKPYCDQCLKEAQNRQHAVKGRQLDPDGLCATCKRRPRLVRDSGDVCIYCAECRRARRKEERKAHQRNLRARIEAGEHVPCIHCDEPRYQTPNHIFDYCYKHYREQQNAYNRRKRNERMGKVICGYFNQQ